MKLICLECLMTYTAENKESINYVILFNVSIWYLILHEDWKRFQGSHFDKDLPLNLSCQYVIKWPL